MSRFDIAAHLHVLPLQADVAEATVRELAGDDPPAVSRVVARAGRGRGPGRTTRRDGGDGPGRWSRRCEARSGQETELLLAGRDCTHILESRLDLQAAVLRGHASANRHVGPLQADVAKAAVSHLTGDDATGVRGRDRREEGQADGPCRLRPLREHEPVGTADRLDHGLGRNAPAGDQHARVEHAGGRS